MMLKTVYDLGANDGSNLPYYLSRAEKVVAVEANPVLAAKLARKFSSELSCGRLRLIHCVLADLNAQSAPFYVCRGNDLLSMASTPPEPHRDEFDVVNVPARTIIDIIADEGLPDFLKIDLEGFDHVVLDQLFQASIYPTSLSAECHSLLPYALIESCGRYQSFQLMDPRTYSRLPSTVLDSTVTGWGDFRFHEETAGPFGSDIPYPWMNSQQCLLNLAIEGLGWRDLHARMDPPDHQARVWLEHLPFRALAGGVGRKVTGLGDGPFPRPRHSCR